MKSPRCMYCMNEIKAGDTVCPSCGYNLNTCQEQFFSLKPNSILHGRYLVGRVLGQGGFGITYIGFDMLLEVRVAIKEYYPRMDVNRDNRQSNAIQWNMSASTRQEFERGKNSFLKEARKMAKIDTIPEIVRIRDMFSENDSAYIIMDFVEGETLKSHILKKGTMSFSECSRLLMPLLKGLEKVHEAGIIHRDISPDNIMLRSDGSIRLLDLGAAKDLMAVKSEHSQNSQLVTKKGFSPFEQYTESGSIGAWTDVYAMCATIYYCVMGRLPPDAIERMSEDTLSFDIPIKYKLTEAEKNVLKKGLAIKTDERTQSIGKLIEEIEKACKNASKPIEKPKMAKKIKNTQKEQKESKAKEIEKKQKTEETQKAREAKAAEKKRKAEEAKKIKAKNEAQEAGNAKEARSDKKQKAKKKNKQTAPKTKPARKTLIIGVATAIAVAAVGFVIYMAVNHMEYIPKELSAVELNIEDKTKKKFIDAVPIENKDSKYTLHTENSNKDAVDIVTEDDVTYISALEMGSASVTYKCEIQTGKREMTVYSGEINITVTMSAAEAEELKKGKDALNAQLGEAKAVLEKAQQDASVNHQNFALEEPILVSAIGEFTNKIDAVKRAADIKAVSDYYSSNVKPAADALTNAYNKAVEIAAEEAKAAAAAKAARSRSNSSSSSSSGSSSGRSSSGGSSSWSSEGSSSWSSEGSSSWSSEGSSSWNSEGSSSSGSGSSSSESSGGSTSASSDKYSTGGKYN